MAKKDVNRDGADSATNVGRRTTRTLSNGLTTSYSYNMRGELINATVAGSGPVLWQNAYGYDAVGNRIWTRNGDSNALGDVYAYDATNQVVGVKYDAESPASGYGSATNPTWSAAWTYDAAGNRETATKVGTAGPMAPAYEAYEVNAINQYTMYQRDDVIHNLPYTSRGDLAWWDGWSLDYDTFGRLRKATKSGTTHWHQYDGEGRRVGKKVAGEQEWLLHAGYDLIESWKPVSGEVVQYIYEDGIDQPLAMVRERDDGPELVFFHQDVLGNVVLLTNEAGQEIERYRFEVWGRFEVTQNGQVVSSAPQSRWMFTGREWDAELGFYHYRARAYSPHLGRFLQQDPIDFNGGDLNLVRYVGNSILNYRDPFGLYPIGPFPSELEAANAALDDVHWKALEQPAKLQSELGGNIYQGSDGCYYYTRPQKGLVNSGKIESKMRFRKVASTWLTIIRIRGMELQSHLPKIWKFLKRIKGMAIMWGLMVENGDQIPMGLMIKLGQCHTDETFYDKHAGFRCVSAWSAIALRNNVREDCFCR